ncbi:MAG: DUF1190 domain-containing protein [Hyphomicrobium sp.]|nr:DUF1190 domain-containing protein [Hyphomicrobium sp.]
MFRPHLPLLAATALLLAGCGQSEPKIPGAAAKPMEKAIFMSTTDCAESGKLPADQCGTLIDRAVKAHETKAPTFKGVRSCEEASGPDRCEKMMDGTFRMRLQAFLFEINGAKSTAAPLYPSAKGAIGFRDAAKKPVSARDDSLIVSQAALTAAHENARLAKEMAK